MYRVARLLTVLLLVAVATPRPQAQSNAIRGFPTTRLPPSASVKSSSARCPTARA